MFEQNRIIPVLQLANSKLVKTTKFEDQKYIGNPLNVVNQFNAMNVDEVVIHDILASSNKANIDFNLLSRISAEAFFPLAYRGGVTSLELAKKIVEIGYEKVIINSLLFNDYEIAKSIIDELGSQAVIASLDFKLDSNKLISYSEFGKNQVCSVDEWFRRIDLDKFGEILITDIERDGTRSGINRQFCIPLSQRVKIPAIISGGARSHSEVLEIVASEDVSVAAGSVFIMYNGASNVLTTYPVKDSLKLPPLKYIPFPNEVNEKDASTLLGNFQNKKMCKRCLITEDIPEANFDNKGICYYCNFHDELDKLYPIDAVGSERLSKVIYNIKKDSKEKKYDCIVGVSGGADSTYLLHALVKMGVRPLAVHFDNTWNTPIASMNIYRIVNSLGVDLETYVVDSEEYDDLYKSFLLSGVKDIEIPTDIGFMSVLYRSAKRHGIKYIIEGHSFRTEGIAPLGWTYMDGRYIRSVHKTYGERKLKTYPNMSLSKFIFWSAFSGIKRVRPLYWMNYNKESAKAMLKELYGWEWYGGHHLENRFTAFYFSYFLPQRWGIDYRQVEFSALVRSNQMSRVEAIQILSEERPSIKESVMFLKNRLQLEENQFNFLMSQPKKSYRDFKTYKRSFERLKFIFWILLKLNRIPESFYVKYCK